MSLGVRDGRPFGIHLPRRIFRVPQCLTGGILVAVVLFATIPSEFFPGEAAAEPPRPATGPSAAAGQVLRPPDPSTARPRIAWDDVYGTRRVASDTAPTFRPTWISDTEFVAAENGIWRKFDVRRAESAAWYDPQRLAAALQRVAGVEPPEAERMAEGNWQHLNHVRRTVVFAHGTTLIRISLDGQDAAVVNDVPHSAELAKFSPTGSAVAFVIAGNLWVADFRSGCVRQLTHDGNADVVNGRADWVYFEEVLDRRRDAFEWSPDGQKVAFLQFDDTQVSEHRLIDHSRSPQTVEIQRYPRPGEPNPVVRPGLVRIDGGETLWFDTTPWPDDDRIVGHLQWLPDSSAVIWYAQNRIQTSLDVVRSSVSDGSSVSLLREETPAWVDHPGPVTFLKDHSFLILSERTGRRHLYRVPAGAGSLHAVTSGDWDVRALLAVGANQSYAVVSASRDSRIADNIYRVPLGASDSALSATERVVRLTPDDADHKAVVSTGGSWFVETRSSLTEPASVRLRNTERGDLVRTLVPPAATSTGRFHLGRVELREVPMPGETTTTAVFVFPPDFSETSKYPVWLMTYGGPEFPSVRNAWSDRLPEHLLAAQGIVVVRFDPRSSSGNGARSTWPIYRQLGVEETRDIVTLCDWLGQQPWVDTQHIGLGGHSYGGFVTAYAMTHCNRLCAGIAGAPVTDWANYDSIYTERFMSTPQRNPDGYRRSSVVRAAGQLHGRLLLIHGLMDDNVHVRHTLQLMQALQKSGRQFDVMLYPSARHDLQGTHYEKLMYNFIVESLGRPEARRPQ